MSAAEDVTVKARESASIKTGIAIATPPKTYGRIAPRSGFLFKRMSGIGAGVVDSDHRGEIKVVLFNHSAKAFELKVGDRIGQLIIENITNADCVESPKAFRH